MAIFNTKIGTDTAKAIELLASGEIVALPTETVYGLAGNALQHSAISKIYEAKNRPVDNPLIVHVPNIEVISSYVENIPDIAYKLFDKFTPGPLTVVLPKKNIIPDITTGSQPTVAIRIPDSKMFLEVLNGLDFPLAAPSANQYTQISPTTAEAVMHGMENRIPYILDGGQCKVGIESTIISINNNSINILREGSITRSELEKFAKIGDSYANENIKTPGSAKKHYSPITPLRLFNHLDDLLNYRNEILNVHTAVLLPERLNNTKNIENAFYLSTSGNHTEIGKNLYRTLYEIDNLKFDLILALKIDRASGLSMAINDKLYRAATALV
jgi:L-threonylcarbamoyladenylate synthase